MLLDEVLAGLNPSEIRDILPVIRGLCDRGITIMMIEHVMQAVMSLAEHVFVLAEGRIIAAGSRRARWRPIPPSSRPISATARRRNLRRRHGTEPLLTVCGLCAGYGETEVLRGIDLEVDAGEIVAVLGSNGVGKSTLNSTMSGIVRARAGEIHFDGAAIERAKPAEIVAARTDPRAGRPVHFPQSVGTR